MASLEASGVDGEGAGRAVGGTVGKGLSGRGVSAPGGTDGPFRQGWGRRGLRGTLPGISGPPLSPLWPKSRKPSTSPCFSLPVPLLPALCPSPCLSLTLSRAALLPFLRHEDTSFSPPLQPTPWVPLRFILFNLFISKTSANLEPKCANLLISFVKLGAT